MSQDPAQATKPRGGWRRWLDVALWTLAIGLLLYRFGPQLGAALGVGGSGQEAPEFVLETFDGDSIQLAQLRGKVVLLNFWATWCGPCRVEMPWFEQLHRDRAGDGLVIVGASTDLGTPDVVRRFLAEHDITYPVGQATPSLRRAFGGVRGLPTSFLIDRRGRIRHSVVGIFTEPALRAAVDRLLAEPE
jgi:peroxiredoxin